MQQDNYLLRTDTTGGEQKYYTLFEGGDGIRQEIEIDKDVYLSLEACRRHEQRQIRSDERHIERSLLSDEQLAERAIIPPKSMDKSIALSLDLQAALLLLSETQRRRFLLCNAHGLNHEQIAAIEGCSARAVGKSIAAAKEQLKKYLSAKGSENGSECGNK